MASQTKCSDTTDENILNTSGKGRGERKFKLTDLNRLTFQLEGQEQALDIETCSAEQFNVFASEMADVEDIDVNVWPLEERRNFVNDLWEFCQSNSYEFPLTEISDTPASEGEPHATKV